MNDVDSPSRVDYAFRDRVAEVLDGNRVSYCYQCGACVGDCPSARYDPKFNPREIMLKALYGLEDELVARASRSIDRGTRSIATWNERSRGGSLG